MRRWSLPRNKGFFVLTRFPSASRYPPTDQVRGHASRENALAVYVPRQRVAHAETFPVRLADVKVAFKHGLHVLEHRIEIVAIDRRIVITVVLGETMRKIAAAAGVHEFALLTFFGKVDGSITRGLPARLVPDFVDRMVENVELGIVGAIAGNPQHIKCLDRTVGHERPEPDVLVADALGR